jgi:hypothetical protein
MPITHANMLQSLRTVRAFLDENAAKRPDVVKTGARQCLDDASLELSEHATDQTGSALASQGATPRQRTLRSALLRDHMAPISRIVRSDFPQTPEVEPLRMPRGTPTIERLAGAAFGMGNAAAPFTNVFVDRHRKSRTLRWRFCPSPREYHERHLVKAHEKSIVHGDDVHSLGRTTGQLSDGLSEAANRHVSARVCNLKVIASTWIVCLHKDQRRLW